MKCDLCGNDATVHETIPKGPDGHPIERHLCESCAASQGLSPQAAQPMASIVKHSAGIPPGMIVPAAAPTSAKPTACPVCKTTFADFKQNGLLGCPDCYVAFESLLMPLLERAHDGGVRHVGKVPKRAQGAVPRAPTQEEVSAKERLAAAEAARRAQAERVARISALRVELEKAVAAEQYERAALIRDELKKLRAPGTSGPGSPEGGPA